jgi:hypothetical protein
VPNLGPGLHSGSAPGTGISAGGSIPSAASPDEPNPNLFLWSEEMQRATWVKSDVAVTADAATHPDGGATADVLTFTAGGSILQASDSAALSGNSVSTSFAPDASWTRRSVSGTFDGVVYVLSVETRDLTEAGLAVHLRLFRSGGFLAGGFSDLGEEAPAFECWGWKLETPDLTAYVKREGA